MREQLGKNFVGPGEREIVEQVSHGVLAHSPR
jgi:hypothetical protein